MIWKPFKPRKIARGRPVEAGAWGVIDASNWAVYSENEPPISTIRAHEA